MSVAKEGELPSYGDLLHVIDALNEELNKKSEEVHYLMDKLEVLESRLDSLLME